MTCSATRRFHSFPTRCWLLTFLPTHRQQRWSDHFSTPQPCLHQQALQEKLSSLYRPRRTWHMLRLPRNFVRSRLVESEAGRRFILSHLSRHIFPPSQFIGETISEGVVDKTTDTAEHLCCEELDLGIWVVWLLQACEMHLNLLEVDDFCSDDLPYFDRITGAVFSVRGKVQQIWTIRCQ